MFLTEECPDGSMPMSIPEDVGEFFDIMTPRGTGPITEVLPGGNGIRLRPGQMIMITKVDGSSFDVLLLKYFASQSTRVIFKHTNPPPQPDTAVAVSRTHLYLRLGIFCPSERIEASCHSVNFNMTNMSS